MDLVKSKFVSELQQSIRYSYHLLLNTPLWLRLLTAFAYFASIWVERFWQYHYDPLYLRSAVASFMLLFVLQDYWPQSMKKHGPFIWNAWMMIALPYMFGTIMLLNAALTPYEQTLNVLAVSEYALSLMFLTLFQRGILLSMTNWLAGTTLALLSLLTLKEINWPLVLESTLIAIPFALTIFLIGAITTNATFQFQKEKEQAIWNIASSIAHQLRTPLATIQNIAIASNNHMERLVDGYNKANAAKLLEKTVPKKKLEDLKCALTAIDREVESSKTLIDILIQNSRSIQQPSTPNVVCSARDILEEAVATYPYNSPYERQLVTTDLTDFSIEIDARMLLHTIYNLLGNGVEFAQKRPNGSVTISSESGKTWNHIYFRDTGVGIPRANIESVFEPFFSHNSINGTGIGLSFCKSVVEGAGGKISVESVENEYTTFHIRFPAYQNNAPISQ